MEEERRFTILLKRVEQQYQVLSEKVGSLEGGFQDLRTGISVIVKDMNALKHHRHSRGSDV